MSGQSSRNAASLWTARLIPAFLVLLVAYASYVVVGPLTINYLINPPRPDVPRRVTQGIAISIVYFVLLFPVSVCWLRLLLIVLQDPGYIPQGSGDRRANEHEPRPGIEDFWHRDVFVCDPNGLPIWCDTCQNWKPDRTHHSQDVGRCTRKMDHFCPWVGGVVGERALKFFIQFMFYTMIFTCYATVVLGFYVAHYKDDVQLFVALGLAGFFLLFSTGMVFNSFNLVFQNLTTIENISRRVYLAVVLPPELQMNPLAPPPPAKVSPGSVADSEPPFTSEIDDPAHSNYFGRQPRPKKRTVDESPNSPTKSKKIWKGTITYPLHLATDRPPIPAPAPRTFAVLQTPPGLNPWNLGTAYRNFKAVFGNKPHDWLLPLKHSPCCDHSSMISEFPLGPEFELLLQDAGLAHTDTHSGKSRRPSTSASRKRKRRLDAGWQNGERPDGWISEKEARRLRNEWKMRAKLEKHRDVH